MSYSSLSIIIPTCDRPDSLKRLLCGLLEAAEPARGEELEIIIADDGPTAAAKCIVETLQDTRLKWLAGPRKGPAANRNSGAALASHPLLVFFDDDCIPDANILQAYQKYSAAHPKVGIFEGRIKPEKDFTYSNDCCPVNESGGFLWSANIAVRREAFLMLRGFDEDFPFATMEDVDFRVRAQAARIQMLFCPDAIMTHPVELRKGKLRHLRHRYSVLKFAGKHPEKLEDLKRNHTFRSFARAIKRQVLDRRVLQPPSSYQDLARQLVSLLRTRAALKHPERVSRELNKLEFILALHPSSPLEG